MISAPPKKRLTTLLVTTSALLWTGSHLAWSQATPANPVNVPQPLNNAYAYYAQAGKALVSTDRVKDATRPTATIAEKEALVQENRKALELLYQGLAHAYDKISVSSIYRVPQERDLARLLLVAGDVQAAHNDPAGATDNYLGDIQLGIDDMRGAGVIAMLSGMGLESMGHGSLPLVIGKLTGSQAKAAAQRLELIESHRVPYSDILSTEGKSKQHDLTLLLQDKNWRQELKTNVSEQQIAQDFTRAMNAFIADASLPYPARQVSQKLPPDPVNQLMLSNYADRAGMSFLETRDRAQNALLVVMLALQAYKMAHQAYPQNLTQLVPEYLQKVPGDPFALSGPLRYHSPGDSYVLYSIGPDGKDDLGQPIYDPQTAPPASYHVAADSVGDIVAGTNTR